MRKRNKLSKVNDKNKNWIVLQRLYKQLNYFIIKFTKTIKSKIIHISLNDLIFNLNFSNKDY